MKTSFKTVSLLVFTVLWLALNDCIAQEQVLINRSSAINSTEILGLSKQLSSSPLASKFGGMYIETTGSTIGKPYVGYALNGASKAYHYYDGANNGWHLYNTGINMSLWPDSAKWVTTLGDEMTFDGHRLQVGKNGNTYIGQGVTSSDNVNNTANTILGWLSGRMMSSGVSNTILGFRNAEGLTSGDFNTIVGSQAANLLENGSQNTYIGYRSGWNAGSNNSGNVFIGYRAGEGQSVNDKLIIANSETTSPLIEGDFQSGDLNINGELYLPDATVVDRNLRISSNGRVYPETNSTVRVYSGDFNDWYNNGLVYTRAVSINKCLVDGSTIRRMVVKAMRYVSNAPVFELKLLKRSLTTGAYTTLFTVSDNNLPTSVTTYTATGTEVVELGLYEYLLVTEDPATHIVSVTIL